MSWTVVGPEVEQLETNTLEQLGAQKVKLTLDENFQGHNEVKNRDYLFIDKILSRLEPFSHLYPKRENDHLENPIQSPI